MAIMYLHEIAMHSLYNYVLHNKLISTYDGILLNAKMVFVTGPVKTRHICTNYTHLENVTFLGHHL